MATEDDRPSAVRKYLDMAASGRIDPTTLPVPNCAHCGQPMPLAANGRLLACPCETRPLPEPAPAKPLALPRRTTNNRPIFGEREDDDL